MILEVFRGKCVPTAWSQHLTSIGVETSTDAQSFINYLYVESRQKLGLEENVIGTDIKTCADILTKLGLIENYRWITSHSEIITVLESGSPLVCGSCWFADMCTPDVNNDTLGITGKFCGMHAYNIIGYDQKQDLLVIKNTWGQSWGKNGTSKIRVKDFKRLMKCGSRICSTF